ncbi:MAG: flagellar filament capping protein FliD [Myxococcota bacterium]|nr:flagellar filament capping protein FliD [Myxococcota bacterium]
MPGTFTVSVDQKAQSSQQQSASYAAADTTLKDGTLAVTIGSTVTNVTIDSATGTNSVTGLADYLTNSVPGVTAYVLDTGAASDPYKLIVTGSDTGLDNAISLSVSQTGSTGEDLAFTESRSAQDAQITVDSNTVTRSSNAITDAIPGLTFNLLAVTSSALSVTVSRDTSAMVSKVDDVVAAYNHLNDYFKDNSGPNAHPLISADQTLRSIQRGLQGIVAAGYSSGSVAGLNSIGLGTDQYGELQFDSSEFSTMLSSNWDDVLAMLTGSAGFFGALTAKVDADIDPTDGLIQPRLDSIDSRITLLNDNIIDSQRRLDMYEETLKNQFIAMETTLAKYQATESYLEAQVAQWKKAK